MIEDVALNYFRNLPKEQRKELLTRLFNSLSNEEKLEVAKILVRNR